MSESDTKRPFTAASFNQYLSESKLMASRCSECGELSLPPRSICIKCRSENISWVETSGKGKLAGFTSVYIAPTFMIEQGFGRENPYISGIVDLDEGVKISARILGLDAAKPEAIQVNTRLKVDFIVTGEADSKKFFLAFKPDH